MHISLLPLLLLPVTVALSQTPQLTGVLNFRDIGGLPAADGRTVCKGKVFRSGELNTLTAADQSLLASLGVRYIFDLRTDMERSAAPTNWTAGAPPIVSIPVGLDAKTDPSKAMKLLFAQGADPQHVNAAMAALTAKLAIDGAPAIGTILRDLSQGQEPAIIHCTAGKDRTGVVTAVLLTILGVSKDDVYKDYLASNIAVPAQMQRLMHAGDGKSGIPPALAALPQDTVKVLMSVDPSYLDAVFAAIDAKYGSFQTYVSEGLNLSPADVAALRQHLTN